VAQGFLDARPRALRDMNENAFVLVGYHLR
jgi:hypothetical protein